MSCNMFFYDLVSGSWRRHSCRRRRTCRRTTCANRRVSFRLLHDCDQTVVVLWQHSHFFSWWFVLAGSQRKSLSLRSEKKENKLCFNSESFFSSYFAWFCYSSFCQNIFFATSMREPLSVVRCVSVYFNSQSFLYDFNRYYDLACSEAN